MLPVRLHIVIGKTQIADAWSKTPDIALSYKTIPIKSPTDRYSGMNIMLINIDTSSDLETFSLMES